MNKKFLWLLMLPLFLFLFIPNDTYALEYKNPKIEIWGMMDGYDNEVVLTGCEACSELQNGTGIPHFVRIYLPFDRIDFTITDYSIYFNFRWVYNGVYDVWPRPATMFYAINDAGYNKEVAKKYSLNEWTYLDGYTQSGYWFRQHNMVASFYNNKVSSTGFYFIDIPFYENIHGNTVDYVLNFKVEVDTIYIIDTRSDNSGVVDNEDIINNANNNQQQTNEKLDEINTTNLSIWETIKLILTNIITFPQKIGEKIGELLDNLSIWDTIVDTFNFIINIPTLIGETFADLFIYLFLPSENFHEDIIDDYYEDITNKLGMLWFPVDLIRTFLDKYINLSTNPVINIPDIKDPVYGKTLIEARSFNIQEIFQYGNIGTVYDIYMIFAGAFIVVLFINYLIKKFNFIINGIEGDSL